MLHIGDDRNTVVVKWWLCLIQQIAADIWMGLKEHFMTINFFQVVSQGGRQDKKYDLLIVLYFKIHSFYSLLMSIASIFFPEGTMKQKFISRYSEEYRSFQILAPKISNLGPCIIDFVSIQSIQRYKGFD